jgi:hypothetical protein
VTSASTHVLFVPQNMAGMDPPAILNRTRVFLRAQRARRPDIPVLLLEGHDHGSAWINARARAQHNYTREAYRRAYNQLLTEGVTGLYYGQHALKFGGRRMTDFVAQVSKGELPTPRCSQRAVLGRRQPHPRQRPRPAPARQPPRALANNAPAVS